MTESILWRSALIAEAAATTALLTDGLASLVRPGWSVMSGAPTWTCLSSGTERLLKLTIGLTALAEGKPWPGNEIRNLYGHRLERLRPAVDHALGRRIEAASSEPYVRSLVRLVEHDPCLPAVFESLALWADSAGRYRQFQILAGKDAAMLPDDPVAAWERAERLFLAQEPALQDRLLGPASGEARTALREAIAGSVLRWWFLHHRAWAHGVFGSTAREYSYELDPRGRAATEQLSHAVLHGL